MILKVGTLINGRFLKESEGKKQLTGKASCDQPDTSMIVSIVIQCTLTEKYKTNQIWVSYLEMT